MSTTITLSVGVDFGSGSTALYQRFGGITIMHGSYGGKEVASIESDIFEIRILTAVEVEIRRMLDIENEDQARNAFSVLLGMCMIGGQAYKQVEMAIENVCESAYRSGVCDAKQAIRRVLGVD